ncbi:MAG: MarR family transcriptional regulator [Chloroflexota bacterium]|nr:MarR family transcriptional regulator [Chloroflexota bacterium]
MCDMVEPRSLSHLLRQVCHLHHGQLRPRLNVLGTYRGQPVALRALAQEDGRTHSELATLMHVAPPTITKMVQRMERAGHVARRSDPEDQRVSRVYLTESGRAISAQLHEVFVEIEAETLAGFSAEEQIELERLLERVRENLLMAASTNAPCK